MLTKNVINPAKNSVDNVSGPHFFLFVASNTQSTLFDQDMGSPIIWGTKDKVSLIASTELPKLCNTDSINLQIYKWSGGKFTFKVSKWVKNSENELKDFIRKNIA